MRKTRRHLKICVKRMLQRLHKSPSFFFFLLSRATLNLKYFYFRCWMMLKQELMLKKTYLCIRTHKSRNKMKCLVELNRVKQPVKTSKSKRSERIGSFSFLCAFSSEFLGLLHLVERLVNNVIGWWMTFLVSREVNKRKQRTEHLCWFNWFLSKLYRHCFEEVYGAIVTSFTHISQWVSSGLLEMSTPPTLHFNHFDHKFLIWI